MHPLASIRLTAHLNGRLIGSPEPAGAVLHADDVVGSDVAHHVVDPDDLLGLDGSGAAALVDVLPLLAAAERERWVLTLPTPGALGGLRGPAPLNRAALDAGEAVVAASGGLALVPYRVGPAVQWRVFGAERPLLPATPYDAERELGEAVLHAAATLDRLDVATGDRPRAGHVRLPGYPVRQSANADRAARLLQACEVALADGGNSLSSYEVGARDTELRAVRDAARTALCAAVTWLPTERAGTH